MEYANLVNIQSCYNFLNSTIKLEDYINFIKNNNFNFAFYSDKNTMYGAAEFSELAKNNNIKPIIGLNFQLSFGNVILFAKNNSGFKKLSFFSSFLSKNETNNISELEDIFWKEINDDLIIISIFSIENVDKYLEQFYKKIKEDSFFIGIDNINYVFFNKYKNVVFAQEINFLYENEYVAFKSLIAIKQGKLLNELETINKNYFFKKQKVEKYINLNLHIDNISKIVEQIDEEVIFDNKKHFLKYPNAKKMPSTSYLKIICVDFLQEYLSKYSNLDSQIYLKRLHLELNVIEKMGFEDYFLIVHDMVEEANRLKILYGPGRGSAAGSLVAFLLKITKLDPIKWDLIFERFLNIDRVTMPDIDIDFQDDRREEILEYLFNKYGKDHFATITTFQTIGIKNALRDCGRIFDIPLEDINHMTKQINEKNVKDLQLALKDSEILKKYKEKYPQVFDISEKIIGLPRQTGTHAAGVVFCDVLMHEVVPTKIGINGISQTQFSMNFLENIGLIKTDILGLRNLSIIQEIIKNIKISRKIDLNLEDIQLNDKKTFSLLAQGDTSGIFQLESAGMTDVLIQMKVNSVEDIALTSALYRPGPQENIPLFIKRRNDQNHDYSIDKNLIDILKTTHGIIVYQEQILKMLQRVALMSLSRADIVRRAIGKKDYELMKKFKNEFIDAAIKNGYSENKANELWTYIEKFASYGFNKSHAIAYSIISYWLAYLKANYKEIFYCSLLNGSIRNEVKTMQYLNEVKASGFLVNPPTIKNPNSLYIYHNNMINIPLSVIKHIGPEFLRNLKTLFKKNKNAFNNILELISNIKDKGLTSQKYIALVYSGAFDFYGFSRRDLIEYQEQIFNLSASFKYLKVKDLVLDLQQKKDKPEEIVSYEKEYLGFFVSAHPLSIIRKKIVHKEKLKTLNSVKVDGLVVDVLINIENIITKRDKNGNEMCFIEILDETGNMIVTIFSSLYEKIKTKLNIGKNLIIKIKTQTFNSKTTAVLIDIIKEI
ncbi:DNA polymerase III subunit alpha [Spiroplasma taiwanense]|uniref:DNA-directed DNA polymerase n=1 Tax=Spiroplasma taiwanense CT-1 TaxID=1276220 RepID=S5M0M0_9MOLU|nr:DNA polymerase III subunit alpha [Spiroplasma taiwanense]AGR41547.1 DNA polymerase III subunit alpha [Spiroplasma taiwanense CT-1]